MRKKRRADQTSRQRRSTNRIPNKRRTKRSTPKPKKSRIQIPPEALSNQAFLGGRLAAAHDASLEDTTSPSDKRDELMKINHHWSSWLIGTGSPYKKWHAALATSFIRGYCQYTGTTPDNWLLLPTQAKVAAIVMVMNEADSMPSLIKQLSRLPLHQTIFVVNGSTDNSYQIVRSYPDATILHYIDPLGHDVGRAIGAQQTDADILLFLDGDFVLSAETLLPFITAIADNECDIALNNITPFIGQFSLRDDVTIVKEFLNRSLGQSSLDANSMTAVPHAMSRAAAELIGFENLCIPPKAQALALIRSLRIKAPASINVIQANRLRHMNHGKNNHVANLIIGDHLEALHAAMQEQGGRLAFPDNRRARNQLANRKEG